MRMRCWIPDGAYPAVDGLAELDGCSDTDSDGVADVDDECPNQIGMIEASGCMYTGTVSGNAIGAKGQRQTSIAPDR